MKPLKFEIYKGKDGFRWRLKASNGKILADSAEAYSRKKRLIAALNRITNSDYKLIDKTEKKLK